MIDIHHYTAIATIFESRSTLVQRATRISDGAIVVLKAPTDGTISVGSADRYREEFEWLRTFDHPLIIKPYELNVSDGVPVLVLEEFDGSVSLRTVLANYAWPSPEMLPLWILLSSALEIIHGRNIIHKDINPNNILVNTKSNEIKIIDFGCASRFGLSEQAFQSPSSLEGTLPYLSPEQTGRANRSLDERSDFYSLGITFYEIASGQLPFQSLDALDLVYAHLARKAAPLHELIPNFPESLSAVVAKLLEKSPERRYQSASGLRYDLETAWKEWRQTGQIKQFALGQHDRGHHFRIVEKLYGREKEVQALTHGVAQACEGRPRLLLVDGLSGTGKTSIVQETYKQLTSRGGYFARGKFDQFKRDVPLSALVQALQEFIRQWLTEPEEVLAELKARLRVAIGSNASVLIEVIPEMRWLLDDVGPATALASAESRNRFNDLFGSFLRTCAGRDHPLVLFLDDLQWADTATLELIRNLIIHPANDIALLVVGAYRTHEVDDAHPLMALVRALERVGAPVDRVTVPSLTVAHIEELLADTLSWRTSECGDLANLLWDRTHGNPFFLHQFLTLAHQKQALTFDGEAQRWVCNTDLLRRQMVAGDVVELLLERLRQLSPDAQMVLGVAACMGARFRVNVLAQALERSSDETMEALRESFDESLILRAGVSSGRRAADDADDERETVRFMHDRVQQAAYQLVSAETRKATHLQIGRRTLASASAETLDGRLFDIVEHFDASLDLIDDLGERIRIAELFLRAGVKAKRATAYGPATRYLKTAISLLPDGGWRDHYVLAMDAHRELNEAAHLAGDNRCSEQIGEIALRNARTDVERSPIWLTQMFREVAAQQSLTAIRTGLKALGRYGVRISEKPSVFTVLYNIAKLHFAYADATVDDVSNAPTMTNPTALACMNFGFALLAPAYLIKRPYLFAVCSMLPLRLAIRYGHTPVTRASFVSYAIVLCTLGRYQRALSYAKLALQLTERYPNAYQECMVRFAVGAHISHWLVPARNNVAHLEKAVQLGTESGNIAYLGYTYTALMFLHQFIGTSVSDMLEENKKATAFAARSTSAPLRAGARAIDMTYTLASATDPSVISAFTKELIDGLDGPEDEVLSVFALQSMVVHSIFGLSISPARLAEIADDNYERYFITSVGKVVHHAYHSLMVADSYVSSTMWGRIKCRRLLRRNEQRMTRWARDCPENFQHYLHLIRAERAGVRGRFRTAMTEYDASIAASEKYGYMHMRAIANERAARRCLADGFTKMAGPYLADAHAAYGRWGATRKVRELEREFPELVIPIHTAPPRSLGSFASLESKTITSTAPVSQLDITTIVRASQALSGERDLDELLRRLMKMVLENAGAQRGVLILTQKEGLRVAATFDADQVTVGLNYAVESQAIALNVVHFVARTQEPVLLNDAIEDDRFRGDPYIAEGRVLSLMCLALTHQRRVTGILYLEHHEMHRAFSSERMAFLDVVASQAAIAVENALLYSEIKATNQSLETLVEERTKSLERTLADLWGEMDLAKKIQTVLLPANGHHGEYTIASMMRPADQVGGDYYDIVPSDGKTWVLIGDVSGHGISAGLIMMMVQTSIRTVLIEQPEIVPSKLLSWVNRAVIRNLRKIGRNDYMTIQAFCFEGERVIYAGLHQEVLVYRAAERRVEVHSELNGMWIGMLDDIEQTLVDNSLILEIGDSVLMFTDGMTEARIEGQLLEVTGLAMAFEREALRGLQGAALITALTATLDGGVVDDDVSLLVVERGFGAGGVELSEPPERSDSIDFRLTDNF